MLVQAESGISVLAGKAGKPTRCGVSIADIALGMYSHAAVLEGLMQARATGVGCAIDSSLVGCLADWLTVSMFHYEADGRGPAIGHGLRHPTIQPYRDYKTRGDLCSSLFRMKENLSPSARGSWKNLNSWRTAGSRAMLQDVKTAKPSTEKLSKYSCV